MSNINKIDKKFLEKIREEISSSLLTIFDKYGMKASIGSIRFDSTSFRTTLSASIQSNSKPSLDISKNDGLSDSQFFIKYNGKKLMVNNKECVLENYKSQSPKYPFIVKMDQKSYKVSRNQLQV